MVRIAPTFAARAKVIGNATLGFSPGGNFFFFFGEALFGGSRLASCLQVVIYSEVSEWR
jgi:hypothetical protein